MYKRYERYKDSGVEWIGEIPEDWDVSLLKRGCTKITDGSHYSPKSVDNGYPYITVQNINNGLIDFVGCKKIDQVEFIQMARQGCHPAVGDVLLTKDGTIGRAAVVSDKKKFVVLSSLAIITPKKEALDSWFLFYWLESILNVNQMLSFIHGAALRRLTISTINKLIAVFPSVYEQKVIVNYLNHKTSEIDSLIADKEKLIKKLEEYKQSIITEAVTKGLNPDVKMKDSGIEWIGEIPEHWSIVKMRYLLDKIKTGSTPTTQNQSYFDGDIDWFTPADILDIKLASSKRKISPQALIDGEAILFEENTVLLVGIGATIGKIAITDKKCSSNQQITGLTTKSNRMLPLYLTYWLHINQNLIKAFSNNTTLPILNNEGIRSLYCILPTLKEQTTIVNYLEQKALHIDELIHDIEDHKDQLREYRQSLIFEAVTGKIDVRDYQLERSEQFA